MNFIKKKIEKKIWTNYLNLLKSKSTTPELLSLNIKFLQTNTVNLNFREKIYFWKNYLYEIGFIKKK